MLRFAKFCKRRKRFAPRLAKQKNFENNTPPVGVKNKVAQGIGEVAEWSKAHHC